MIRHFFIITLALLGCAFIWWVGPLVAVGSVYPFSPVWIRALLITLILFWLLRPWLWHQLARVDNGLRHASRHNKTREKDITAHNQRFYDALATMKYVNLAEQRSGWRRMMARFQRPWRNDRPWYLVLGPQESGKTALLSNSQQNFLLAEQYGLRATTSPGATRELNWWISRDAVWIDTPGAWSEATSESDKARQCLLRSLRRRRGYPAIDGLFLCLNAATLLNTNLTEHKAMADALRSRLLDCAAEARCDLPVYLVLTHLDCLPGGDTLLALLDSALIPRGIGFSLNMNDNDPSQAFMALQSRLSDYILELLHEVNVEEDRRKLLVLLEALGVLRTPLHSLITQIFPSSPVGYITQLRHVWFGSTAPQQQTWVNDNSWPSMEQAVSSGELWQAGLQHAIRERHVLFNEKRHVPAILRISRVLCWLLSLSLLGGAGALLASRYQWEQEYLSFMNAAFDESRRLVHEVPATQRPGDNLIAAYEQLGYINAQLDNIEPPYANPYFEHRRLNSAATATWHRLLLKIFWPAVESYVVATLQQEVNRPQGEIYGTLKTYMMLAEPLHRDPSAMADWFLARWAQFAPPGYSEKNRQLLGMHLRELFSLSDIPATQRDSNLVRMARVKAAEVTPQQRVLNRLQETQAVAKLVDVTLASAAGNDVLLALRRKSSTTANDVAVPRFYTRSSYRDIVLPQLNDMAGKVLDEESWVMSDQESESAVTSLSSTQRLVDETRKFYLLEYANHWASFMNDIRARPIQNIDDAALLSKQLAEPSSPLANLLRSVTRETSLSGRDDGGVTSWFDRQRFKLERQKREIVDEISGERSRFQLVPEITVEDRFQPLRQLGLELAKSHNGSDGFARAFNELYNQLAALAVRLQSGDAGNANTSLPRARLDAARQPEPVRSVMFDLIAQSESQSTEQSRQTLSRSTAMLATGECKAMVASRYPFASNARQEVGIDDFTRLFAKNGTLQDFFDQNLAKHVDMLQQPWRAKQPGLISEATLRSFENAAKIRESWFLQDNKPGFGFLLTPQFLSINIAEAVLDIDGQIVRYAHDQTQPIRITWPGPKGGSYVRLTFKSTSGNLQTTMFEGPWALFHLYDAATVIRRSADSRELSLLLDGSSGSFSFLIRATQKEFPLWSRMLRNFKCP